MATVKVGDVFQLKGSESKYTVYSITGLDKGVPSLNTIVFLRRIGRPNWFVFAQQLVSTPEKHLLDDFTPVIAR